MICRILHIKIILRLLNDFEYNRYSVEHKNHFVVFNQNVFACNLLLFTCDKNVAQKSVFGLR